MTVTAGQMKLYYCKLTTTSFHPFFLSRRSKLRELDLCNQTKSNTELCVGSIPEPIELKAMFYEAIFLCNLQRNKHCVRNVARQVACVWHPLSNLQRNFVRMGQLELIFHVRHLVCYCTRCKLRKKLRACDTHSAT